MFFEQKCFSVMQLSSRLGLELDEIKKQLYDLYKNKKLPQNVIEKIKIKVNTDDVISEKVVEIFKLQEKVLLGWIKLLCHLCMM